MKYEEFDKKYNTRDRHGVILECSVITVDGNVLFRGNLDEVENYWDDNIEVNWENGKVVSFTIKGKEVITTNLPNPKFYNTPDFKKLQFEVL